MSAPQHLLLVVDSGEAAEPRLVEASAEHPQLSVMDVAATRGDGIFETFSVVEGRPQALDAHLERFARSARMLDLPTPHREVWRTAVVTIGERLADHAEGWIKIVLSRGIEGQPLTTGWAYGTVSPDYRRARTEGLSVVVLDRGYRSDVAQSSPWLLAGAKTLSYAINRAALREAQRRGADDVIFVSTDGLLLEGPTSTVVVRRGNRLSTPPVEFGILPGTTQADLFEAAGEWGLTPVVEPLTVAELNDADAAWLVSSSRHAAPIRALDGRPRAVDSELSTLMNNFLYARLR